MHSCAAGRNIVEKRTDFKNEVHALLDKHGITYDWDLFSVNGREILAGEDFSLDVVGDQLMESFLSIIDALAAQIVELESLIEETAASPEKTQLLMTIPGVSFYSSLLITSAIGEINRFDEAKEVVSYLTSHLYEEVFDFVHEIVDAPVWAGKNPQ